MQIVRCVRNILLANAENVSFVILYGTAYTLEYMMYKQNLRFRYEWNENKNLLEIENTETGIRYNSIKNDSRNM